SLRVPLQGRVGSLGDDREGVPGVHGGEPSTHGCNVQLSAIPSSGPCRVRARWHVGRVEQGVVELAGAAAPRILSVPAGTAIDSPGFQSGVRPRLTASPPYCTCSLVVKNRTSGQSSPVLLRCQAFLARKTGEPLWSSAMVPLFEATNFLRWFGSAASIQRAV